MSIAGRISSVELRDLFLSLVALVIAFSVQEERKIARMGDDSDFDHRRKHRIPVARDGSQIRSITLWLLCRVQGQHGGLALAIVMAFGGFLFAAPGAVMISRSNIPQELYMQDTFGQEEQRSREKKGNVVISLAGPMTNVVLTIFFLPNFFLFACKQWGKPEAVYGYKQPNSVSSSTLF